MALTPKERELLAVVKYYNSQRLNVRKLVAKLFREVGINATQSQTGFTVTEVFELLKHIPATERKKIEKRIQSETEKKVAERRVTKKRTEPKKTTEQKTGNTIADRVADEIRELIDNRADGFCEGEVLMGQRELIQRFQTSATTISKVVNILREENSIKRIDPSNPRSQYVIR